MEIEQLLLSLCNVKCFVIVASLNLVVDMVCCIMKLVPGSVRVPGQPSADHSLFGALADDLGFLLRYNYHFSPQFHHPLSPTN